MAKRYYTIGCTECRWTVGMADTNKDISNIKCGGCKKTGTMRYGFVAKIKKGKTK